MDWVGQRRYHERTAFFVTGSSSDVFTACESLYPTLRSACDAPTHYLGEGNCFGCVHYHYRRNVRTLS